MERETGIEPATNSLEGCDSAIELLPPTLLNITQDQAADRPFQRVCATCFLSNLAPPLRLGRSRSSQPGGRIAAPSPAPDLGLEFLPVRTLPGVPDTRSTRESLPSSSGAWSLVSGRPRSNNASTSRARFLPIKIVPAIGRDRQHAEML